MAEDAAQGVDGLALESDVGVDADMGVAEEFPDHDEVDALPGSRVAVECPRAWERMREPGHRPPVVDRRPRHGRISCPGRTQLVHRVVFRSPVGEIPEGFRVRHAGPGVRHRELAAHRAVRAVPKERAPGPAARGRGGRASP